MAFAFVYHEKHYLLYNITIGLTVKPVDILTPFLTNNYFMDTFVGQITLFNST